MLGTEQIAGWLLYTSLAVVMASERADMSFLCSNAAFPKCKAGLTSPKC